MPAAAHEATAPGTPTPDMAMSHLDVPDRMHRLLVDGAEALIGCTKNDPEEVELAALADLRQAWISAVAGDR